MLGATNSEVALIKYVVINKKMYSNLLTQLQKNLYLFHFIFAVISDETFCIWYLKG